MKRLILLCFIAMSFTANAAELPPEIELEGVGLEKVVNTEEPKAFDELTREEISELIKRLGENKEFSWKGYGKSLLKTAGHTGVFSAGVIFTFIVCAFCNEYPWLFKRLYGTDGQAEGPAEYTIHHRHHRSTSGAEEIQYVDEDGEIVDAPELIGEPQ